ncbi:hypothetical protein ACNRWW_03735 [Metabacillus sp. HB246100]|uniref:hypothetical protein n=1 Tax=Bacillus weihaiensis TaxID=1547283 RepID=UPI00235492FD|nr:hypothetical protein [Bacillus weihaiensis]
MNHKQNNTSTNTMIRNMEDLKKQSKVMEQMKTNKEIKKTGKQPDPVQYIKKDTM